MNPVLIPTVTIQSTPSVIVAGQLTNFTSVVTNAEPHTYQWVRNHVAIPGATDSVYSSSSLAAGDTICLVIHTSYVCARPDSAIACEPVPLGISNIYPDAGISIYPNPNNGDFTLQCDPAYRQGRVTMDIFDLAGKKVAQQTFNAGLGKVSIHTLLVPGIYLAKVTDGTGLRQTLSLVIK